MSFLFLTWITSSKYSSPRVHLYTLSQTRVRNVVTWTYI